MARSFTFLFGVNSRHKLDTLKDSTGSPGGSGIKLRRPCEGKYWLFRWLTSGLPPGATVCERTEWVGG